mmetsp:Transcript_12051/g.32828  ORF Transcript_12051/g.32828 Transcript_12051/m.32828 type:complete len:113 (+) Transcript_12051:1061-1399(+)
MFSCNQNTSKFVDFSMKIHLRGPRNHALNDLEKAILDGCGQALVSVAVWTAHLRMKIRLMAMLFSRVKLILFAVGLKITLACPANASQLVMSQGPHCSQAVWELIQSWHALR